jgi:hypothetical protein
MQRLAALMVLTTLLGADVAYAGPWLREDGKGFASGSVTLGNDDPTINAYAEYGFRPTTTLGIELETYPDAASGRVTFFVVKPLGPTDRTWRKSWAIGSGVAWSPLLIDPTLKAGVSAGRGLSYKDKYGWFAVDTTVEYRTMARTTTTKLDTTVGLSLTERTRGMLQVFLTYEDDVFTAKLAPSVLYQHNTDGMTLQIGAEIPNSGVRNTTLKIGLWRDF